MITKQLDEQADFHSYLCSLPQTKEIVSRRKDAFIRLHQMQKEYKGGEE